MSALGKAKLPSVMLDATSSEVFPPRKQTKNLAGLALHADQGP